MTEYQINATDAGTRLDRILSRYLNAADSAFLHKMLRKKNIVLNGKKADGATRVKEGDVVTLYLADETVRKFRTADTGAKAKAAEYRNAYLTVASDACAHVRKANAQEPDLDSACRPSVLYEDDALLLVNKPQGVLSQKDRSGQPSLNEWAIGYLLETGSVNEDTLSEYTPSVANRLDRNTSGLMVVTKTRSAARAFSELQRRHALKKHYHAVVCGETKQSDTVYGTVEKGRVFNRMAVSRTGKKRLPQPDGNGPAASGGNNGDDYAGSAQALTYRRLAYGKDADLSLLRIKLSDGKKHQIRAQMANLGHPVLLDEKYGNPEKNRQGAELLSSLSRRPAREESGQLRVQQATGLQLLHSFCLTFPEGLTEDHPLAKVSGKTFVAPHPYAFEQLMLSFYARQNVVYMLLCADLSLYCGWTNDIAARIKAHNEGKGAKYTRGRGPVHPVYLRAFDTKEEAMKEEARIKGLSREEKLALIR